MESNMLCTDCNHHKSDHGKQIPERPPSNSHIIVCNLLINDDYRLTGKWCNCGGAYPQPAYYDPGCFNQDNDKYCGCIGFIVDDTMK